MNETEQIHSRRRLLKAAGYTLSLPVLMSMRGLPFVHSATVDEESKRAAVPPKRFCCIFFPNGVSLPPDDHPDHKAWHWFPHQSGGEYQLTQSLEPLSDLRSEMTILGGLSHPPMRESIAHITADSFLTAADSSDVYTNSISMDQVLANAVGTQTRFPSLALSSDGGVGAPGRTQTLSFSASGTPIPSLASPRKIFNRLFGVEAGTQEEQQRKHGRTRSILDHIRDETRAIERQLSNADQARLDEYLDSVREIEHRLSAADKWLEIQRPAVDTSDLDLDVSARDDAGEYIRAILDLMYVALLTDSTRSITYQITSEDAKGVGDRFPMSLGLSGHHALSHGTAKKEGFAEWASYDRFLAEQLAYFVERLRSTPDPFQAGSLLDHTLVFYGGSTSRTHLAANYPLILAGGSKLGFAHGQYRIFDEDKVRLSDLYVTMLQQLGVQVDQFADSTTSLPQLLRNV